VSEPLAAPAKTTHWITDGITVLVAVAWHAALILLCERYVGIDAFFHVAESRSLITEGLFAGVTSLPFTVLGEHGTDHHFLFHLLGLPLAFLPDFTAVRSSAVLFAALATGGLVAWMRHMRVPRPWLWALLLLATSEVYNFRMSLLRSQTVDVPLLLFGVAFVVAGRPRAAAILAFAFSWAHHGATILVPTAALCVVATLVSEKRVSLRAAAWLVGGFVLGQLINPWFPQNLEYLFFHALFKTANPLDLPVGGEWLPALPGYIATELWPAHAVMLGLGARLFLQLRGRGERPRTDTIAVGLVWAMFVVLTLKHGRFVGFLVPIEIAFISLLSRDSGPLDRRVLAPLVIVSLLLLVPRFSAVTTLIDKGTGQGDYTSAAKFLETHTEEGEVVFNVRWDNYPFLVFHSPRNRFVIGLDPNYLAYRSPKHFQLWNNLRAGERLVPHLSERLKQLFGARYLIATAEETPLLARYPELTLVHRSPAAMIWRARGSERD